MKIPKFRMLDDGLFPCDMCNKEVEVNTTVKIKGEDRDYDFVCKTCVEKLQE